MLVPCLYGGLSTNDTCCNVEVGVGLILDVILKKNIEMNLCLPLKIPILYVGLGHARCWSYVYVFDLAGPERLYGFRSVCAQAGSVRHAKISCIERGTLNIRAV